MTRATTSSRRRKRRSLGRVAAGLLVLSLLVLLAAGGGSAGAGEALKSGVYTGKTAQETVSSTYRTLQLKLKKGKVTLTTEPTVARGFCLSTPVFTAESNPTKKLSRNRSFTFTHTFFGSKMDKIHGRFVSSNEVEGYALYHFFAQDLCSEGKTKVTFTAKHK